MDKKKNTKENEYTPIKKGYRSWSNFVPHYLDLENQKDLQDKTIPNDSFTIKEIVHKFVKGIPLNISTKIPYYDNEDIDNMPIERTQGFDLAEAHEAMTELAEKIESQKKTKKQKDDQKQKAFSEKNASKDSDITKDFDKKSEVKKVSEDEGRKNAIKMSEDS